MQAGTTSRPKKHGRQLMFRLLTIFTLMIGFVAEAWADIPPAPPPTGQKYVRIVNQVRLG
jgi:hypothetical protein